MIWDAIRYLNRAAAQLAARLLPVERATTATVTVRGLEDLPDPIDGVIPLEAGRYYHVTDVVTFDGLQLRLGAGTVLEGTSSESAALVSTGLSEGVPFLLSPIGGGALPMRNLRITADGPALALDGEGGPLSALDWQAVNFVDCPEVGTIAGYTNFIMSDSAFLNSAGLVFDDSIGTVGFFQCIWTIPEGETAITLPATFTATRRFRWTYSPMVVPTTSTGVQVADLAGSFPNKESFSVLYSPFSGSGTFIDGAAYNDPEVSFFESAGLTNSAVSGNAYMIGNATATPIAVAGTYYKALGTTTPGDYIARFTAENSNELVYTGALPRWASLLATATLSGSANKVAGVRLAINGATLPSSGTAVTLNAGGRVESVALQDVYLLQPGDTISIYVANETDTSAVTAVNVQLRASAIA